MNKEIFNIYKNIKFSEDRELEEIIYEDRDIKILRTMSLNQVTQVYDQKEIELVFLISGSAKIKFIKGKILELEEGDFLEIKAHEKHQVVFQNKAVWICIFRKRSIIEEK